MENETKHTPTPWRYGGISGHIYEAASGVHLATMEGLFDDGPGPFRDRNLIAANVQFLIEAVNSHDALTAQIAELTEQKQDMNERIKKHIKNELRQKGENNALTAALDGAVEALNVLLIHIAMTAPDRFTANDPEIVRARAALATAKKARGSEGVKQT